MRRTRRLIHQYTLDGEPYIAGRYGDPATLRAGDLLSSPLFPAISRQVERIFRRVRGPERPTRRG